MMNKRVFVSAALALMGSMALAASACAATTTYSRSSDLRVTSHNGHGELTLHSSTQTVEIRSHGHGLVTVLRLDPAGLFGLHVGDAIVAVNGHRVAGVKGLERSLRALSGAAASLQVRRNHAQRTVALDVREYAKIVSPAPPAPPAPPSPPAG